MYFILNATRNFKPRHIKTSARYCSCCEKVNIINANVTKKLVLHKTRKQFFPLKISIRKVHSNGRINYFTTTSKTDDHIQNAVRNLLKSMDERGRVYLDEIHAVLGSQNLSDLSREDADIIIQCCGNLLPDQIPEIRSSLCEHIKDSFLNLGVLFSYPLYVSICTENQYLVDFEEILGIVEDPDVNLYKVILENICSQGDTLKAIKFLAKMKSKNVPVDEDVFNSLVLAHAIEGGLNDAKAVLETMRTAHVFPSINTYVNLLKGLSRRKNEKQFETAVQFLSANSLSENHFLHIVQDLSLNEQHKWIEYLLPKKNFANFSKQSLRNLDNLCIQLIHLEKCSVAIEIYTTLVPQHPDIGEGNYGLFLLREMLKKDNSAESIISATKHLKELNLNENALQKITETSLRRNYHDTAWDLLKHFQPLRPHYFWPLLLTSAKQKGEVGLFDTVSKMIKLGVRPDEETWEFYIFPYSDFMDAVNLINRFKKLQFTTKELVSPLVKVLLKNNKITEANKLVEVFDCGIDATALTTLVKAWMQCKRAERVVPLLQKICETNPRHSDWTGQFLEKICNLCVTDEEFEKLEDLLKVINSKRLRISANNADLISNLIRVKCKCSSTVKKLEHLVDNLLDVSYKVEEQFIPHPRNMNVEELECHYEELQSKNMETRGVLRLLIQAHARLGNLERVQVLRSAFISRGYAESPGMKANMFHNYVLSGNLNEAQKLYEKILSQHPKFRLDSFKILDFATLMVRNGQEDKALNLIKREATVLNSVSSRGIEHNCIDLLSSYTDAVNQRKMFDLIVKLNFFAFNSSTLKPLVEIHLKSDNIEKAVEVFIELAEKYKVLGGISEILSCLVEKEDTELLEKFIKVIEQFDRLKARNSVIEALAKKGLNKVLRNFILNSKGLSKQQLQNFCAKLVKNNQLTELQVLAEAVAKIPSHVIDKSIVYNGIMQIHSNNNDCESALAFWLSLEDNAEFEKKHLENELLSLLKRCKFPVPENIKIKLPIVN